MLSHDWPLGIYHHGDIEELIQTKQHLKDQIYKAMITYTPSLIMFDAAMHTIYMINRTL